MTSAEYSDLCFTLLELRHQYPRGVTTWTPCNHCEQPARGGGMCVQCLSRELQETWSVPQALVRRLLAAHEAVRDATNELEDVLTLVEQAAQSGASRHAPSQASPGYSDSP